MAYHCSTNVQCRRWREDGPITTHMGHASTAAQSVPIGTSQLMLQLAISNWAAGRGVIVTTPTDSSSKRQLIDETWTKRMPISLPFFDFWETIF